MNRVAAIAMDGAEWTYVQSLIDAGALPNLAGIRDRSAELQLHNEDAPTGLVWQGFLTGRKPPKSSVGFDKSTYTAVQYQAADDAPFFSLAGVRTIAFDVPRMSLRNVGPGIHVTSWGAHGAAYPRDSRPRELLAEIDSRFGPHPAYEDDRCHWQDPDSVADLEARLIAGARTRAEIARFLFEKEPDWQLFFMVFSESHSAGESFWHGQDPHHLLHQIPAAANARNALSNVHKAIDESIGRIVAALPEDTTVVIFSIHGMKANTGDLPSAMLLPELLYRQEFDRSFLAPTDKRWWSNGKKPPVVPKVGSWPPVAKRTLSAETPASLVKRAVRAVLPTSVEQRLIHKVEERRKSEHTAEAATESSLAGHLPYWYRSFWAGMLAFALPTFADGRIRLNLKGREHPGIVEPADYAATRSKLAEEVMACTDPRTGATIVEELVFLEGDPLQAAPTDCDIRVVWKENVDSLQHPTAGQIGPFRFGRTGGHTERGFALIAAPGSRRTSLGTQPARQLVPTLLELLGAPVPDEVEGAPLRR